MSVPGTYTDLNRQLELFSRSYRLPGLTSLAPRICLASSMVINAHGSPPAIGAAEVAAAAAPVVPGAAAGAAASGAAASPHEARPTAVRRATREAGNLRIDTPERCERTLDGTQGQLERFQAERGMRTILRSAPHTTQLRYVLRLCLPAVP